MRKLLIVSYVFPPAGGITVQRALSFAKYLPALGFEVHVLTARNPAAPVWDPALLKHVPPEVRLHRCFTPELPFRFRKRLWALLDRGAGPSPPQDPDAPAAPAGFLQRSIKRLLSPDPQVVWVPFAVRAAAALIRRHGIDTVLTTAPPFSVFLIGHALKRRFPYIQLISDFRDEWLRFYLTDFAFLSEEFTRRRAAAIERATIELSGLVLAVTRSSLREIRQRYPEQPDDKFAFVANGYDPDVFRNFLPRPHQGSGMVVTHLGTVYRTASPGYYLDALDTLPEPVRKNIETRFIGRIAETEAAIFQKRLSTVRLLDFLPQSEALRKVEETDYLLLTMTNDFSLPGKLFEYMATGKPILALSPPDGEVARLLRETGTGFCVDPTQPEAIRQMLLTAWERWRDGQSATGIDHEAVRRYERPRLAAQLADLIQRGKPNPPR